MKNETHTESLGRFEARTGNTLTHQTASPPLTNQTSRGRAEVVETHRRQPDMEPNPEKTKNTPFSNKITQHRPRKIDAPIPKYYGDTNPQSHLSLLMRSLQRLTCNQKTWRDILPSLRRTLGRTPAQVVDQYSLQIHPHLRTIFQIFPSTVPVHRTTYEREKKDTETDQSI